MAGNSTDPGRSVTSKVTAILMAFTGGAVLSLTEIAHSAKLPTSTAHRLASELLAWRLLERTEDGGYRIGLPLRIISKGGSDLDTLNRIILVMRAQPVLLDLAKTAHADARLGVLNDDDVVYLGQSSPTCNGVSTRPAHATAMGKALLAFSPTSVIDRAVADHARTTKTTSAESLRQALSSIRLTQIATVPDPFDDRIAIAMPIFSGGGRVAAAVELTVRDPAADINAATAALTVACRSLSRQLATEAGAAGASPNGSHAGNGSHVGNGSHGTTPSA